jgi:porphobilinogen deaminase
VGAHAISRAGMLTLSAQVTSLDGREQVSGTVNGTDPDTTGTALACMLRERGATAILDQIREPTSR